MTDSVPPQQKITANNKSPLIQVFTWIFLAISVLAFIARIATKLIMMGKLKLDDHLATAATAFAIAQAAAVLVQCDNGLGTHIITVDRVDITNYFKSEYAASILFIASLCFAKLSLTITISGLTPQSLKRAIWGIDMVISIWALSGILEVLFQCDLPEPWKYLENSCTYRSAFWTYFSAVNIVTDLAIIAVMVEAVRRIQTFRSRKLFVAGVFGSRILVVPAVALQIYYSKSALSSSDPTFDMWKPTLAMQVVQSLSIVTACIPVLKPFLDSLESGQLRADDLRRKQKIGPNGYNSDRAAQYGYKSGSGQNSRGQNSKRLGSVEALTSALSGRGQEHELADLSKPSVLTTATATATHEQNTSWDGQSRTSQKGLIQQTKTWEVEVEDREEARESSTPPL